MFLNQHFDIEVKDSTSAQQQPQSHEALNNEARKPMVDKVVQTHADFQG